MLNEKTRRLKPEPGKPDPTSFKFFGFLPTLVQLPNGSWSLIMFVFVTGVVHEHPRIGSDGESEEGSRTSEDVVSPANRGQNEAAVPGATSINTAGTSSSTTLNGTSSYGGVKMRQKADRGRKLTSQEEINKRLSLPADLKLPDNFVEKQARSP